LPFVAIGTHRRVQQSDIDAIRTRTARLTRDQERSLWIAYAVAGHIANNPSTALVLARKNLKVMRQSSQWTSANLARRVGQTYRRSYRGSACYPHVAFTKSARVATKLTVCRAAHRSAATPSYRSMEIHADRKDEVNRAQLSHVLRAALLTSKQTLNSEGNQGKKARTNQKYQNLRGWGRGPWFESRIARHHGVSRMSDECLRLMN